MSDPYGRKLFDKNPYGECREIRGEVVAVLDARLANRKLDLIKPPSRCLCRHEIHELILTTEQTGPGQSVESVHYVAFFEVLQGGVARVGNQVEIAGKVIGHLAGYDETHAPNHLNVVLYGPAGITGGELGLKPGDPVVIRQESGPRGASQA